MYSLAVLWLLLTAYYIQHAVSSVALEDAKNAVGDLPAGSQVVELLVALHAFGGEDDEDGVLVQEVVDQNAADFIVIPLLRLRPALALGLVQFSHQLETFLVSVVSQATLQQRLVEVEPPRREPLPSRELLEQFLHDVPRLVLLLDEAEDLVDLVRDDVSVLVLLVLHLSAPPPLHLRQVVPVLGLPSAARLSLSHFLFFIPRRAGQAQRVLGGRGRGGVVG